MLTQPIWRISAFAVGLAVVLAAGIGIGRAVGPIETDDGHTDAHSDSHSEVIHVNPASTYDLVVEDPERAAGGSVLEVAVVDHDGDALTSYDVAHGKLLHLILVRWDLGGYRHVHPELDQETGRWNVPIDLGPGSWRAARSRAGARSCGRTRAAPRSALRAGG